MDIGMFTKVLSINCEIYKFNSGTKDRSVIDNPKIWFACRDNSRD